MKQLEETKSSGLALIPFLLFIVIYMGAGIILQMRGVEMAFYQFPSVVAMSIAVIAAFVMFHKAGINENFATFAKGAASEDVVTMLMIYLLAGGFSAVAGAMGGIESTVNRVDYSGTPAHCRHLRDFCFYGDGDGNLYGNRGRHCADCRGRCG